MRFDPAAIAAQLHRAARNPCLLCGRPPYMAAVWFPSPACSRRLGVAAGKIRLLAYTLCRKCHRRPDAIARVEAKILDDAAATLATPESN